MTISLWLSDTSLRLPTITSPGLYRVTVVRWVG